MCPAKFAYLDSSGSFLSHGKITSYFIVRQTLFWTPGAGIEASFKRGKGEVGMDEYQVRTVRRESTIEECGNTIGYTGIR